MFLSESSFVSYDGIKVIIVFLIILNHCAINLLKPLFYFSGDRVIVIHASGADGFISHAD